MSEMNVLGSGSQEPPDDPMIYNRRQPDGTFRSLAGFFQQEENMSEQRDTTTIAGKFAEALGCIEDALNWLGQVNEQYDPEQYADEIRLVRDYGLPHCNPAMDFWLQAEQAEDALKRWLSKLQRVEPLAPKEVVESGVIRALVTAIGRHPAAEDDAEIADAISGIEDALKESQGE